MALAQVNLIRNQERLRGLRATPCDWLNALPLCYMSAALSDALPLCYMSAALSDALPLCYMQRGIVKCATALLYERG